MVEYNPVIHNFALCLIELSERRARYEDDCLKADVCAQCGNVGLVTQPSKTRRDAMGLLDETVCPKCGFLAQLN